MGSLSAKNFSISNDLNHAIIVKVEELEPELQHSKALCQIIPSGCVAGFDIYFSSKNLGKFKKAFTWKINGIHTNKVFVMAEVVPIELEMSRTDLIMEFPAESVQPTLTQDIMLTNPGNASADFLWGSAGAFQCNPEKGSIAAGKSAVISITWSPLSGKRSEEELGLHVTSGIDQTLRVRGILKETKADFVEKRLLLGTMAVGTEKKLIAQIRNSGEHPLSFFINPLDERLGISLTPERECILPGEILPLNITIIPKFAMNYDNTTISAKVLGGKQISLKMAGSSIIPQLTFAQDAFTFGTVAIGSEHRLPFIITNKTGITATLVLDLYQQQDFKPCLKYSLDEGYLPHTSQSIKSYQEDEKGIEMKQIDVKRTEDTTTASPTRRSKKKSHSNVWWISIPPNGTMEADLIFRPTSVRAHIFKLKLNLQGMVDDKTFYRDVTASGQASILELSSNVVDFGDRVVSRDPLSRVSYFLETTIKNVGMKSGFSFEVRELPEITKEFGGKSATHSTDAADDPSNQIFFVSPTRGDLAPGGSIAIRITFQPQSSGDYFKRLEVYIKGQDDKSRPYTTILCTGSGLFPRLSFDRDQVHLPTVPLGVTSRASFAIVNNGYSSLGIAYKISPNIPVLVDVSFPDGNSVGIMVEQIRVHLAAKSEIPISWSGKIEFYDQDGERFVIAVSGCSDNCLLTNYPFVRSYHDVYGFIGLEDQPVKYMKKNDIAELRQLEAKRKEELRKQRSLERQRAVANAGDGDLSSLEMLESKKGSNSNKSNRQIDNKSKKDVMVNIDDDGPGADSGLQHEGVDLEREDLPMHMFDPTEIIFLLHLLNKNICRKPFDLSNFPVCITDTQGDIFVDCLEQMSGKRIPFVKSNEAGDQVGSKHLNAGNKPRNSEKQTRVVIVNRLVFKYQQMINFVIGHGALLGHINPISLLGVEDYLIAQEFELTKDKSQRFTTAMLSEKRKLWEQQWPETCQKAWLDFIYQAVKVYVLSRINFKDYARTPGVVLHPKEEAVYRDLVDAAKNTAEKGKSKKRVPTIPKCYQPSNVYSHSEALLLAWASYHLEHAGNMPDEGAPGSSSDSKLITFNKRVTDLDTDFKDLMGYFQLIHSHLPDITKEGELLSGYTAFDRTKKEDNYSVLSDALKHLQMDLGVRYQDIVSSSRSILLLLLHFYLYLPNLIPKTKVEFTGQLGYPIAKKIELKNPSQKPVAYNVTLWGSADFSIDTTKVVIPPESCVEFSVALRAKFCETVSSKLTFWGVREAGVAGATMSFQLISNIIGRRPVEKITRNVFLYDLEHFSLSVRSPFSKDGTFHLQLKVLHAPISIEESIRGPGSRKVNREDGLKPIEINRSVEELQNLPPSERKVLEEEIEIEHIFQQPFWCFDENIPLSKTSVRHLNVSMLPFVLGKYVCQLIFVEKDIGEFSYEIHVEVGLPKASDKLDFSALYGGTTLLSLKLASKNSGFEKALSLLTETRIKNPNKKIRARSSLQSLLSSPIISEDSGQSNFLIEFLPSFFIYKKQLPFVSEYISNKGKGVIKDVNKYKKCLKTALEKTTVEETNNSATLLNTVLLAFAPEKAGTYCTTAVLYSKDNKVDVRVVDLSISVGMPDSKIVLEFRGPAREKITQEIPVKNESEQDWNLTINITGKSFYAQKALFVPAMSECPLEICFRSPVSGKFDGVIQLKNIDGMDAFQYNLTGIAEEPLAAANFYFQSSARSSKVCTLPLNELISNDRPNQNWKVETDLPYISGPEAVTVTSSGGKYEFTVNSPVGGMLNGYISFTEQESGEFVWYTVSVEVTSPLEETAIEVRTTVRSAVAIEITLENPTSETLVFDVSFHGDGLIGETTFSLEPSSKDTSNKPYELIYSPLIAGNFIGKISFHNEMAGELWYKLKLTADPAPPVDLGTIESMLGSANFLHVPVENPLPEDITFMVKISNPDLFYSGSDKISLGPYEQSHFNVFYRPASLTDVETCSVVLSNKNFGEIQYKVSGTGLLPGLMPQVQIDAALGEIGSTTIVFRNPFAHPLPVDVVLSPSNIQQTKPKSNRSLHRDRTGDNQSDKALQNLQAFQLLLKNPNGVVIAPKSSLHIAISFAPERLAQFEAVLEIRSNVVGRSLLWCYPIYGMAEAGALQRIPPMVTMCKTSLVKEFFVPLEGISEYDVQNVSEFSLQDFSVEVDIKDEKYKAMILRSFRPQIVGVGNIPDNYELPGIGRGPIHYQLSCRLLFEPLRTFATSVDLIVICQNRGKWRLTLDLEATDPEADDVVRLVAPVGGADKVTFRLSNRFLGYSHFQAYFSVKSSSHFRVSPVSGVLAPFGSDGTPFVVTFAPTSYGNIEV